MKIRKQLSEYISGCGDGIPIFLGYLAVSFTFGIKASETGLNFLQAGLMSLTNLTSAGQFAALGIIAAGSSYFEMVLTQLIINLRYCLMSCALSQKLSDKFSPIHRFFISAGVTDEIFAVSISRGGKLSPYYSYGVMSVAVPAWTAGTVLGVILGGIMPPSLLSAFGVAIYGMFLAIIIPPAKHNRVILGLVAGAMLLSFGFDVIPYISMVSSGFRIIIITVLVSAAAAWFFPLAEEEAAYE